MTMTEPRVHLDLSVSQAQALKQALDLYARMGIGQINEIADLARMGIIKMRDADTAVGCPVEKIEAIQKLCMEIKGLLGHPENGNFGIGHPNVSSDAKRSWEIRKVLAKVLADEFSPGFPGVDHQGLILRYTDDPEPIATLSHR